MLIKISHLYAAVLAFASAAAFAREPLIIAHRGGAGDGPENTEYTIRKSIDNNVDAVWITLQLSKDNHIVLYRPSDLTSLTNLTGSVSSYTFNELKTADAAYRWAPPDYPLRGKGITIPELPDILKQWPDTFFFLDIKSPDAEPQHFARILGDILQKYHHLSRVRVYSTDEKYLNALPADIPRFESRDLTRAMLANITMNHRCLTEAPAKKNQWFGFELSREVQVVEKFTLGTGVSNAVLKWDDEAIRCFRGRGDNKVVLFGINNQQDYLRAKELGADGVLIDSPETFRKFIRVQNR